MGRSVSVELLLDVSQYKRGGKEATDVNKGLAHSTDEVGRAGGRAGRGMAGAADEMSDAARAASSLDRQIEQLGGSLRNLAIQRALGAGDFTKQIREQERELRRVVKDRNLLGNAGRDSAPGFVASFVARAGPLMAKVPFGPPLVAAVAAASPLVGAAVTAGIVGGISAGAVAGGVAVAFRDERVKAEATAFGEMINSSLDVAFADFVPATIGAIGIFEERLVGLKPELEEIGRLSAKMVAPLARGTADFVEGLTPGLLSALEQAEPVVREIESMMGQLGGAAGSALDTIAGGSEEAALALGHLGSVAEVALTTVSLSTRALTEIYPLVLPAQTAWVLELIKGEEAAGGFGDKLGEMAREMQAAQEQSVEMAMAQHRLEEAFISVAPRAGHLSSLVDGLRKAQDLMFGSTMRAADANQAWHASWDSLTESVKNNGRTLNIHTAAGRANRDMLKDLAQRNNDLFFANIEAGMSIEQATRKHQARIVKIKEEARQLGLNKAETQRLINTYGRIPKAKSTDLLLQGVNRIVDALLDLYLWQRALATGQTIGQIRRGAQGNVARFKAAGGRIDGHSPSDTADNIPIWATADEWVIRRPSARKMEQRHPGALDHINRYGNLPGYASGGLVAPIDTSRRWPFEIDVNRSRIPSRKEVASKVAPSFGRWPSSPGAQRGDSGIWRQIIRFVRNAGIPYRVSSAYRHGDPLWHGSGRAVDFGGYNQDRLAGFFMSHQSKMLELIHRSNRRDYGVSRGRRHYMGEGLLNAHRNHVHAAMRYGGPVMATSSGGGRAGAVSITNHFTISGAQQNPHAVASEVGKILAKQANLYARGG